MKKAAVGRGNGHGCGEGETAQQSHEIPAEKAGKLIMR